MTFVRAEFNGQRIARLQLTALLHSTSILGEALYAGFGRLNSLLQQEFHCPAPLVSGKLAQTLGFADWEELCECAISTTSRNIDTRLECLVEGHLPDDDLAERLAATFGTTASRMVTVLSEFRHPEYVEAVAVH